MRIPFEVIDINTFFGPSPTPAMDLSLDLLVQAIKNHGITRACTLSTVGFRHNYGEGNAATLAACDSADELIPVATVDPRGFFSSSDSVAELATRGFRMFRFFPDHQDWPINYAPFIATLDSIEKTGLPVMISVAGQGQATTLLNLAKGRPNAFILTDVPYEGVAEAVTVMKHADNIFLETHSLQASGALALMVREVGVGKLLFGSGCPGASLAGALRHMESVELPESDKTSILSGNAKRLLQL